MKLTFEGGAVGARPLAVIPGISTIHVPLSLSQD